MTLSVAKMPAGGKKLICPGCQARFVPGADDEPPARPAARPAKAAPPRRQPAEQGSSKTGLIIGASVGAGVLVIGGIVAVVLLLSGGSTPSPTPPGDVVQGGPIPPPQQQPQKPPESKYTRAIREATDANPATRAAAIRTIGQLGPAGIPLELVIGALKDQDPDVRLAGVEVVRKVGLPARQVLSQLVSLLQDPAAGGAVAAAAARVIGEYGVDSAEAVPALEAAARSGNKQLEAAARQAVERIGQAPVDVASILNDLRGRSPEQRRAGVVRALMAPLKADTPRAEVVAALEAALPAERIPHEQPRYVDALAHWSGADAGPKLLQLLPGPTLAKPDVQPGPVMAALVRLGHPGAAEKIAPYLHGNHAEDAMMYLCAIGPPAEAAVLPYLNDTNFLVPNRAAEVLAQVGGSASVGPLQKFIPGQSGPGREKAEAALKAVFARTGTPDLPGKGTVKVVLRTDHTRSMTDVAVSPDGERIAVADASAVTVFDRKGKKLGALTLPLGVITVGPEFITFTADGRFVLAIGDDPLGSNLSGWELQQGKFLNPYGKPRHATRSLSLSGDGKYLAVGQGRPGLLSKAVPEFQVWETASGKLVSSLGQGHKDLLLKGALSHEGKRLATGSMDGTVKVWDVASGKEAASVGNHGGQVWHVAFRPDGKQAASGGTAGAVLVWDPDTGKESFRLDLGSHRTHALAYSPDGKFLATGTNNAQVIVWEAETGRRLVSMRIHDTCSAVRFSPDSRTVYAVNSTFDNGQWKLMGWSLGKAPAGQ
jgi:DNA-binding beta-propeller fold protein YncE/HEAT repeat protein